MLDYRTLILCSILLIAVAGCETRSPAKVRANQPPTSRYVVEIDLLLAGASPKTVDSAIGNVAERALRQCDPPIASYRFVTRFGKMRIFATGDAASGDALLRAVETALDREKKDLPAGTTRAKGRVLQPGEGIPKVAPRIELTVQIHIDRERQARLGITQEQVTEALRFAFSENTRPTPEALGELMIDPSDGRKVRLSDIAVFHEVLEPDAIIRTGP